MSSRRAGLAAAGVAGVRILGVRCAGRWCVDWWLFLQHYLHKKYSVNMIPNGAPGILTGAECGSGWLGRCGWCGVVGKVGVVLR